MTAQARLLGGRYQVAELLGYGGMAEVHKGRDLRLGRDVAIKMLRTDLARDPTFQERFRREAQNAAALNHPAIVAVYDTGEEISSTGDKLPFIVMEFVNGQTLKEVLAAEQRLAPRRALEFIADICAALEFSHRHGIIHRDIKPGNVMLTQTGQVKVMDFGIARALASGATTMTQTSAVIGTAQYLSPEQARGESVDARSDVYAAGCVLFELLCGHPPFVGDSPVSVAYQHVREDPRTPSDINPEVPPDVDAIVLKALAKNPLNRYQSAQEMRADALRAVAGRPVMATPVMSEAETMAMAGPPRYQTEGTRPIPAPPPPPERTSSWAMAVLAAFGVLAAIALGVGLYLVTSDSKSNNPDQARTPPKIAMPALEGKTDDQAQDLIEQAGLTKAKPSPQEAPNCDKGKVMAQNPKAGTLVDADEEVTYTVCQGPGQVRIPDNLIGSTVANVEAQLENLGLQPQRKTRDSDARKDDVLELSPGSGKSVDKGSSVTVVVSNGNLKEVPNVVGSDLTSAKATLQAAGFNPVEVRGSEVDPDKAGRVEKQTPDARSKEKVGSRVTLTVSVPRPEPAPTDTATEPPPGNEPSEGPGAGGGDGTGDGAGGGGGDVGGEDDEDGIIGRLLRPQPVRPAR